MKLKLFIAQSTTALLLAGCTSAPSVEPKYDELDLMVYNLCLDKMVGGNLDSKYSFYFMVPTYIESALEECAEFRPIKN